jgi:hypothetical protein
VAEQPRLLVAGQVTVLLDVGGVLHEVLVERHGHAVVRPARVRDRHEGRPRAEEAGVDERPLGLARLVVEVDRVDLPDLVAVGADERLALPVLNVLRRRHGAFFRDGGG